MNNITIYLRGYQFIVSFNHRYAYTINNIFAKIIAIQFAVSMLVVCSNMYRIAMATDYLSLIPLIMYTSAILMQIFIYCWFGNEVKLKVYISYPN